MPVFEVNPTQLSKSRLKSDLVAHNVTLPSDNSKKDVYVDLYLKHIDSKNATDFSSDEEDQVVEDTREEEPTGVNMLDPSGLTDDELKAALLKHGFRAGPIVASTRALYERRLQKLLQSYGPTETALSETGDANAYSDSEEEEEDDEGAEEVKEEESDSDDSRQEALSHLARDPEGDQQESSCESEAYFYQRCFLTSPRLRASAPGRWEPRSLRNVGNAVEAPLEASRPSCSHVPAALSATFSVDEPTGLGPALDVPTWEPYTPKDESVFCTPNASSYKQTIKERLADGPTRFYPKTVPIPAGITATCRRPIKGAAGRPVQYKYPDAPPASPLTLERREVEGRLVPVYIQILVFLAMACLLYLVYACMEENSYNPLLPLLDGLSEVIESEEGPVGQAVPVDQTVQDSLSG